MSFSFFSQLPTEVQCQIWQECLPKRIIQVNFPDLHRHNFWDMLLHQRWDSEYCVPHAYMQTLRANHTPPLISRVCKQSREVAHMYGKLLEKDVSGDVISEKYWVQPRSDVLYLNQNQRCLAHTDTDGHRASSLASFIECANSMNMPTYLSHRTIFDFSRRESTASFTHAEAITDLQAIAKIGRRPLGVVVKTIALHVKHKVGNESGLFGLFSQETLQSVDIWDITRIRRYRSLWEAHAAPRDSNHKPNFDLFDSPQNLEKSMQLWLSKVYYRLIGAMWIYEVTSSEGNIAALSDVWCPPIEKDHLPSSDVNCLNYEHPWVQETFLQLPEIQPKVIFRHCFSGQ